MGGASELHHEAQHSTPGQVLHAIALLPVHPTAALADEAALAEIRTLSKASEMLQAKLAARMEQYRNSGGWASDGSRSADGRLARETGTSTITTKRYLRLGKAAGTMTVTHTEWLAGRLSTDMVGLLSRANSTKRAEVFARDEAKLVRHCQELRYNQAKMAIANWMIETDLVVDPDGTEPMPEVYAKASVTFQGAVAVDAMLDLVGGEMVMEMLDRIERELYRGDLAAGIERSMAQRRGAALVEMAVRAGTAPVGGKRPEPLICVVAGEQTLARMCESLAGTTLRSEFVVPYLSEAQVQSFVYDGAGDITRVSSARSFRGRLRRAIQVRDRHCQHPSGCDVPATRCDGDHIVRVADGGVTSMKQGRLLCDRHNRNPELRDRSPAVPAPDYQPELLDPPSEPAKSATATARAPDLAIWLDPPGTRAA